MRKRIWKGGENDVPGWLVKSSNICNAVSLTGGLRLMISRKVVTPAMALSPTLASVRVSVNLRLTCQHFRLYVEYLAKHLASIPAGPAEIRSECCHHCQHSLLSQTILWRAIYRTGTKSCCQRGGRLIIDSPGLTVTPTFPSAILELNHSSFSHTDANFIL